MYDSFLTLFSLIILTIPIFVFHIITFGKSRNFFHITISILVTEYTTITVMEFLGFVEWFDGLLIFLTAIGILVLIGFYIHKNRQLVNNISNKSVIMENSSFMYILLFGLFLFFLQKNAFPPFLGDSYIAYLPWAKTIALDHFIPAYDINSSFYTVSYPPLAYTKIAFLFSILGSFSESISSAMPLFYACLTIFILIGWAKEKSINGFLVLIPLIFSLTFLYDGRSVLQEPPLILFFTVSFYFMFKYLESKDNFSLVLLSISLSLSVMTKYSGFLIFIVFFIFLLSKYHLIQKRYLLLFILLQLPWIVWLTRNLLYYDNPFYPLFSFISPHNPVTVAISKYAQYMSMHTTSTHLASSTFKEFVINTLIGFPCIIFAIIYFIKKYKDIEVKFFISIFVIYFIVLNVSGNRYLDRYFFPFIGLFAFFAAIEISKLLSRPINIKILDRKKFLILGFLLLSYGVFTVVLWAPGHFSKEIKSGNVSKILASFDPRIHYEPWVDFSEDFKVYDYLKNNDQRPYLRIYGDSSYILYWYGNYTVFYPGSITWVSMVNGSLDYEKDSNYFYSELTNQKIDYIYDSPLIKREFIDNLYVTINNDTDHFKLLYDENGYRLWRIK